MALLKYLSPAKPAKGQLEQVDMPPTRHCHLVLKLLTMLRQLATTMAWPY